VLLVKVGGETHPKVLPWVRLGIAFLHTDLVPHAVDETDTLLVVAGVNGDLFVLSWDLWEFGLGFGLNVEKGIEIGV
jgi:hypothetical protein